MKYIGFQAGSDPITKQREKIQMTVLNRLTGTAQRPSPPRDVFVQSAPRGVFVTWKLPEDGGREITGWRIYKNDESTLFEQISDRGNRQKFVDSASGSSPVVVNVFVSSINAAGYESQKIQVQGSATAEAAAPTTFPTVPPGYNAELSGGSDKSNQTGDPGSRAILTA